MKKNIVALVMLCSSVVALGMSAPARAEGKNSIGPSLSIGNGQTTIGIDSRFGVSENLSLRPFVYFPSGGTTFGSGLTYDFNLASSGSKVQITPFVGGAVAINSGNGGGPGAPSNNQTTVSFTGGADFAVTDTVDLKAALDVPLSSNNSSTTVRLGAGFRF
jgi:opacity protein-like surface antigen